MEQKIVVEVRNCDKCRFKAMKIAAVAEGVKSVALEGTEKNQVVVIGEEVDSAGLTHRLRKKVGYACLVSVEEVKPPAPPAPVKLEEKAKADQPAEKGEEKCKCSIPCQRYPMCEVVIYDPNSSTGCSIM